MTSSWPSKIRGKRGNVDRIGSGNKCTVYKVHHSIPSVSEAIYWSWSVQSEITGVVCHEGALSKQLSFKRNFCVNIVNWPYPPAATIDPPVSQGVTFDPTSPCQSRAISCPVGTSWAGNLCSRSSLLTSPGETSSKLCQGSSYIVLSFLLISQVVDLHSS